MKYYFSSPTGDIKRLRDKNVTRMLFSFGVDGKNVLRFARPGDDFMIDSGAFSAWNSGKMIDADDYLKFCLQLPQHWIFINLDVIPPSNATTAVIERCAQQGFENYQYLRKKINNLMPVYHYGEDIKWLEKMMEDDAPIIGISPDNSTHENVKRRFLDYCFSRWDRIRPWHALGYSSFSGLLKFPFYSVDSISYKRLKLAKRAIYRNNATRSMALMRIDEFLRFEKDATAIWAKRGVSWDD